MSETSLKLAYIGAQLAVRLTMTRQDVASMSEAPLKVVERAKAKMEAEQKAGKVKAYFLEAQILKDAWQAMRNGGPESITLTLAQGAPPLPGWKVQAPENEKSLCEISIDPKVKSLPQWRIEWLQVLVREWLVEHSIAAEANVSQIHAALVRAQKGDVIHNLGIGAMPEMAYAAGGKAYAILANKTRMEVAVVIKRLEAFSEPNYKTTLLELVKQAVRQLAQGSGQLQYFLRKKEFLQILEQAEQGAEALGVGLPIVALAAIGVDRMKASQGLAGRLEFSVSPDRMEVTMKTFDRKLYDDPKTLINIDFLNKELARLGVKVTVPNDLIPTLNNAISRQEDLTGMLITRGTIGKPGQQPFLMPVFRDAAARIAKIDLDNDAIDLRELQQRSTVKEGQLVAKVRFKKEAAPNVDVFGAESDPEGSEPFQVKVGVGIEEREPGKFFALSEGVPIIDGDSISLSSTMVHEGDVNLRSGNIRFDGPVEIKGSVDSGATVEATGDILIHGEVRGGFVKSRGNITIKVGVNMGMKGRVQCRGDLTAEFIQNSRVICHGTLRIKKACLNSEVVVGQQILVGKGGVVAGGQVICRGNLRTDTLGFLKGAITNIAVGVDWRAEYAMRIREARISKVVAKSQEDRVALRELVSKKQQQMTARHNEMKTKLQERLQKARVLLEKMQQHLANAKAMLSYEEDSKIYIRGPLYSNVDMQVGESKVRIANDVAGVAILPTRKRGTHIHPIEEIEAQEKADLQAAS